MQVWALPKPFVLTLMFTTFPGCHSLQHLYLEKSTIDGRTMDPKDALFVNTVTDRLRVRKQPSCHIAATAESKHANVSNAGLADSGRRAAT